MKEYLCMNIAARKRHDEIAQVECHLNKAALKLTDLEDGAEIFHHRIGYIISKAPHDKTDGDHDEREQIADSILTEQSVLFIIITHYIYC